MLRRAVLADPAYGLGHLMLAALLIYTRRYRDAIAACHRAQIAGESPFHASHAYAMRAQALVALGDLAAARAEIEGGRAAGLSPRMLNAAEALIAAHGDDTARAPRLLEMLDREPPGESYGCEIAASAAGRLGDAALASRLLVAAERIDQRHWPSWRLSPDLAAARLGRISRRHWRARAASGVAGRGPGIVGRRPPTVRRRVVGERTRRFRGDIWFGIVNKSVRF